MENKDVLVLILIALVALLSLATFLAVNNNEFDEQALADKVTANVVAQLPDQQEIDVSQLAQDVAVLIEIPTIDVPEFESDSHVQDLWEDLYSVEITELETESYDAAVLDLEDDDYELLDDLFSNLEYFDEIKTVDIEDYDVTIVKLGLDEDDDKVATIEFELKVKYSLSEGVTSNYRKTIIATATVTFEEGDFDAEDVDWEFPEL